MWLWCQQIWCCSGWSSPAESGDSWDSGAQVSKMWLCSFLVLSIWGRRGQNEAPTLLYAQLPYLGVMVERFPQKGTLGKMVQYCTVFTKLKLPVVNSSIYLGHWFAQGLSCIEIHAYIPVHPLNLNLHPYLNV